MARTAANKPKIRKPRTHALRSSCKYCYDKAGNDHHRFHGACSFRNTHKTYCKKHRCGCQK